jgi:glycosyl transferase family 2
MPIVPGRLRRSLRSRPDDHPVDPLAQRLDQVSEELSDLRNLIVELHAQSDAQIAALRHIVSADYDRVPELRSRLLDVRGSAIYRQAFTESEPLISVRIATYNRSALLIERALASVFQQTYPNFEVIVVGDGCTDDTADRLRRLDDPRVTFVNLPHQGVYPEQPELRWMVAGAPAMNLAAQLARGSWIAPLDDDDEFTPDHLEVLIDTALSGEFEMAYGNIRIDEGESSHELRSYPPRYGHFGFQAAIYTGALRFFEYDLHSWVINEVADWTMCRRMLESGVRIGWADKVVTTLYPHGPRH